MWYFADLSAINRENKARYSTIIACITFGRYCSSNNHPVLSSLDLRQEIVDELKAMVDDFNENTRTIKNNMMSRHKKERKKLLLSYKKRPSGKYASVLLTEQLDILNSNPLKLDGDKPEADC